MDSKMWKPDVEAFDQYFVRFSGILNELNSISVSKTRGLIGRFISRNEEFYLVEKNLCVNLDGLGLEEGSLRRNLFTDQHNRGSNSEDYNRTTNPVSVRNSAIFTIQPSMDNTMVYPSAVGESRQQLVVTRKVPQFTSFLGDNWRKFIIKWSDYSISVGSNCRSISESTSILCKQQASMFLIQKYGL